MTILGMDVGTFVALLAGVALIATVIIIFFLKLSFPAGGLGITLVGLVLITISQWSKIKVSGEGLELERRVATVEQSVQRVQKSVRDTTATVEAVKSDVKANAQAASVVAVQTENAAQAINRTSGQLAELTRLLETRKALPTSSVQPIYRELTAAPKVDLDKLRAANETLKKTR